MNLTGSKTEILIVEDSPTQAEKLKYILEEKGFSVFAAKNGIEALDILGKSSPKIIVSDVLMPEMDGYELCKRIRSDKNSQEIPIILLTSLSDPKDVIKGLESGANNFIVKPYDERYLLSRIDYLLANLEIRKNAKASMGINVFFAGENYFITAERLQILDLLLSTYENAYHQNLELIKARNELKELNEQLEEKVEERTSALREEIEEKKRAEVALHASEAELRDNYLTQSAINMVLSESLGDMPLEEILHTALNMILSITGPSFGAIGSIHLLGDNPDVLEMKAWQDLPLPLVQLCAHVPFGTCLCGKAAQSRKIEFADRLDERHEICCEGMPSHGHYAVPILYGNKTLGVLTIHLKEGHVRNQKEVDLLSNVANTLAGIITRRQVESEKKKLYLQLLQAQKMEAVGQLAGGIAHDFNNILTAIIGYAFMLKKKITGDVLLGTYADYILSLSDKAANLTQSLLAFSRKQVLNPTPINLNEVIGVVEKLLFRIIGEDIRLRTLLSENDVIVLADHVQIEQVLMNLATNARDAMPGGGLLSIGTETVDIDAEFINEHGFGKEGTYALISVADTGTGMNKETKEKIFEPFFTTKEVGKGTGLGLAMVYGIVKQHDGYINVYSEPGIGTTVRIYLPVILGKADAETIKPEVIQPLATGTETILLAEDEDAVRAFTRKLFEESGYKVIEAIDGEDAIGKFKLHKDKIQLVMLDVIMPNKNGREVYKAIKKIAPDIKILFTSGYPAEHINGMIAKGTPFIIKPLSPTKLLQKVREVLDA